MEIASADRQLYREKVGELLAEKIMYIAESMNRPSYVPKMPNQPELDLIFDTSFMDIQPYLFKVTVYFSKWSRAERDSLT